MRRKRLLAAVIGSIGVALSCFVVLLSLAGSPATVASGGDYTLQLNTTNGVYSGGDACTATTTNGNEISFAGTNLSAESGYVVQIGGNGSFYNVDSISNITSFKAMFSSSGSSYIYASYWWDNDYPSLAKSFRLKTNTEYTLYDSPSYLKIYSADSTGIAHLTSLTINYDCGVPSDPPSTAYTDGLTISYSSSTGNCTVTKMDMTYEGDVYIPDTYTDSSGNTGPVTSIGTTAFNQCYGVTKVRLPETVTSIGYYAFQACYALESIDLSHVTSLGEAAFKNCLSLKSVTLSESLTTISPYCFCGDDDLTMIRIPDSVTNMYTGAFSGCKSLATAIIGDGLSVCYSGIFDGCTALSTLVVGKKLNKIGTSAFSDSQVLVSGNIVYFHGTPSDLRYYSDSSYNNVVELCEGTASVYYYDESITTATDSDGNHYWHYDDSDLPVANA